mmetsp:Transcript_25784/g.43021  ORF Transcript_25784/g.43021 Transcript_25784/m.43021 type:complete len:301 (-) Transcript_25784:1804-2706(-)
MQEILLYYIVTLSILATLNVNGADIEVYNAIPGVHTWPSFFHENHTSQCTQCMEINPNLHLRFQSLKIPECTSGACQSIQKTIISQRHRSSWGEYYPKVVELIKQKFPHHADPKSKLRIVEVGTCWGGNALHMAINFPCANVVAVDPFLPNYDEGDGQSWIFGNMMNSYKLSPLEFSKAYATAMFDNIASGVARACNYNLVRGLSVDATAVFPDHSIDFLFIDGLHTYEGVAEDARAWHNKVKPGGIVMFNDYAPEGQKAEFPGVQKAVAEYSSNHSLTINCCAGSSNAWVQLPHHHPPH